MTHKPPPDALTEAFEREREQMHRQMLASVSHDLKTPLAAVIGSLEIHERMRHTLTPEKSDQLLATALSEAYRLDNFVSNILDMAKIETGHIKSRPEKCELSALVRDCVEKAGHRFKNSRVSFTAAPQPIPIETDPALLCRTIGLLLDNALKHGGAEARVNISATNEGGKIVIEVSDNGPGIPEDKLEAIFSKYTRFARADHQNAGTGLGLAIGRALTGLLQGTLTASNHAQGGARFIIELH